MKRIDLSEKQKARMKELLFRYSSYDDFSKDKEAAYEFTEIVGIRICPYCNINYIYTVRDDNGKEEIRPDIDHFVPKSHRKDMELQWDNLIPSCLICNERVKKTKIFDREKHVHPYYDDFDSLVKFKIILNRFDADYINKENFSIELYVQESTDKKYDYVSKAYNSIFSLKLEERYQNHKDEVEEIFKRIRAYNSYKIREISNLISEKDFKSTIPPSLLFPEKNFEINQTSLGKLKKDVLEEFL